MKKKILIIILLIIVGVIDWSYKNKTKNNGPCKNCNIMLIDIDVLRADELPCYGYFRNIAPNICALAKKSTIFMDNYSISSWTLPDIFSTITSLLPTFHKVLGLYTDKLSPQIPTLAETLHNQGYRTIFVGNNGASGFLGKENGGLRGYDEVITDKPIEWVVAELSKGSKPWFIHYYWSDLHMPYLIPEGTKPIENLKAPRNLAITDYDFDRQLNIYLKKHYTEVFKKIAIEQYKSIITGPDKPDDVSVTNLFNHLNDPTLQLDYLIDIWQPIFKTYMESFDQNNPNDVAYVRMMYDTKIKLLDEKLGKIFNKIDSWPLRNKTITVVTSDHGEAFGEHGFFSHDANYHSELYYTPLIISSPNLNKKIVESPSSNLDIFPTLLDLVGIKKINNMHGKSLLVDNSDRQYILSEDTQEGIILQNKQWLYYLPGGDSKVERSILYNKTVDPKEKNNVAKEYPQLTESLFKQADVLRFYRTIKDTPEPEIIKLSPEKIKRMQKEGYF